MPIIEGFSPSGRSREDAPRALEGFTSVYKVPMTGGSDASGMRNPAAFLNDTVITTVNSGLGVVKGISDFVSVDNPLSKGLDYIIKEGERNQSDIVKQAESELGEAIDTGGFEAVKGVGKYVVQNPIQTAAKIAGGLGPIGKGIQATTKTAQLFGLGARGTSYAGRGAGAVLSGSAAGGDAASDAYEQVMNSPNIPDDQKEALARQAARQASVVPAVIGGVTGATGLERIFAGGRGITREGIRRTAGKEFLSEGIEEGSTKASANIAAMQYDPTIDPMRGVVGSATMGGVMGLGGGAGVAYLNNRAYESNILGTANPTVDQKTMLSVNQGAGLSTQDLINVKTGVTPPATKAQRAAREAEIKAALAEPSGIYVSDENGIERELSMGEAASLGYETPALGTLTSAEAPSGETTPQVIADDLQAAASKLGINLVSRGKPVQKRIDAFTKAVDLLGNGAIDKATFDQTIEQLKKNRYAEVNKMFTQAEADFQEKQRKAKIGTFQRAPKPEGQDVSTTVSTAGGPATSVGAGGVDVSGGLASTGPALAVGPGGDVGARVAGISPAGDETSLLGNVSGKPATTLTLPKLQDQYAQTSLEDQLAIGELTGNAAEAQALTEEDLGQRIDATETEESQAQELDALFEKAFETSQNKERDIEIAKAYLEIMKNAPRGFKQKIQVALGEQYGIGFERVKAIGETPALVDVAVSMGMTRQQALDLLQISDTSKKKVSTSQGEQTGGLEDVASKLGIDFEESDSVGYGYDDTRTWAQSVNGAGDTVNATDEAMANAIYTLSEKIIKVDQLADRLPAVAATLRDMKAKLEEALAKEMKTAASRLKPNGKIAPRPKKETAAAVEDEAKLLTDEQLARAKEQEARRAAQAASRKNLEVGDTVVNPKLGTGVIKSFSGDGDATMAKIAFQNGQVKDLMLSVAKLEKTAGAPVTEAAPEAAPATEGKKTRSKKTETKSQVTGRDVWENLQKDTPGLGDYDGLSKNEKAYVEEVAARTNGEFTLVAEPSMEVVIDNHMNEEQVEDIYTEDFEADDGTSRYSRSATSQQWKDNSGNTFKTQPTSLAKLIQYPGIVKGLKHLQNSGLISTAQNIERWLITTDNVPWDGLFALVDGKPTIIFSQEALNDEYTSTITLMHEVGHGADGVVDGQGGIYSSDPALNLTFKNNTLRPVGAVAREVYNHFVNEPDSPLSQMMVYPIVDNTDLTSDMMREEIFAQLYAFNAMSEGRQFLKDNLPQTAAFMERTNAKIKQSSQAAGAVQGAQSGQVQGGIKPQEINGRQIRANKEKILKSPAAKAVSAVSSKLLNSLVFTEDLFNRAVKAGIKTAEKMDTIYRERTNLEGQIERDVERVASLYNKIPVKERGTGDASANKFVYDMTREKKWGFEPTWRTGTSDKVKIDPAMSKRFDALSQPSRDWIEAVFAHGDAMLKLKKQTLMDATNSEYDALIKGAQAKGDTKKVAKFQADKKAQLAQFARLFAVSEFNPYAPMKRFGNYVVIAKSQKYLDATPAQQAKLESDPDHYHVSFAESTASALELQRELEGTNSFAEVVAREKEDPSNRMYGGLMQAFNKLRGDLDAELSNVTDPKEREALTKARAVVADLYLSSLAENSARKAEMRRKGVAGEIDMLRSFATQGRADAQFLATAKYSPQMTEAINEMRRETKKGGDQLEKSQLFNEIMARHNQSLSYDNSEWSDVAAKANRVTSVWMLATSPMYYLQNLTQPIMLSVPFMAGRHNYFKAQAALIKAYTQLGGLNKNRKIDEPFDFENVPADVRKMISTLVDRGRIDIGMETELGKFQVAGESLAAQGVNKADRILRSVGQKMEAVNRVSTAIAAYRLELAKTGSIKDATEYADSVIAQTHGDYTRINAPRAFNTNVGKVALQFRKFQLIQLTLLTKLVSNSLEGATKAERVAARKALAFTLGHTAALAGLVGMPGFAALSFFAKGLAGMFGDDEEPYNLEKELYEALVSQWGEDAATLILRGAPASAGIDLSGKLGMGNTLSVLPFTDFELSKAGVTDIGFALTFGAAGSLAQRFADGLKLIGGGEYHRGLEKLAPKGVADAMKAIRENNEGVTRLNGDVLVPADEIAAWESTAKFFGVPVTSDTKRRFLTDVKFEEEKAFKDKAAKLKNQYTKARREGDDTSAIREKWAKLQEERVSEGFKREPLSSLLQAPQAQAKRERETTEGIQFNKQTRRFTQELVGAQ